MLKIINKIKSDFSVLIPDSQDQKLLVLQVVNCLSLHKNISDVFRKA
jgi:hypothetical protein